MTAPPLRGVASLRGSDSLRGAAAGRRAKVWLLRLLLLAIVAGAWTYGTGPGGINALILPPLSDVLSAFGGLLTSSVTWWATAVTLTEMAAAAVIAVVSGVGIAFFLSRTPLRGRAAEPMLAWGYMFPFVLLYPLFILWIGLGMSSKIAYATVAGFFPIVYNSLRGLRAVDQKYVKVGVAFGASRRDMDVHIKAGAGRPLILSGIRIGVSVVMISVVLAELLASSSGLGYELQKAASTLEGPRQYAIVLLLVLITAVLQLIMERAVRPRRE